MQGQPVRIPAKDHHIAGALVSNANQGAANWPPPSFSPKTGLFYVPDCRHMRDVLPDRARSSRRARSRREEGRAQCQGLGSYITAIDYKTGKIAWQHKFRTIANTGLAAGLLTTAGDLLFAGDVSGNFIAFDPVKGCPCGIRSSVRCRATPRKPTRSTASSTCWWQQATRSSHSRCIERRPMMNLTRRDFGRLALTAIPATSALTVPIGAQAQGASRTRSSTVCSSARSPTATAVCRIRVLKRRFATSSPRASARSS